MEKNVQQKYMHWLSAGYAVPFFICGLMVPCRSFAQTDTSKKLDTIKILSSRSPKIQAITPSQTVTSNEFSHFNAFNVADAIQDFSGVIVKDYGGIGGLKTVSVRGLGANHTAVLYDDVEISDAENGQIDLSKFNLNNVQSITLYNAQPPSICMPARSFASASVLSITTIKPNLTTAKPYQITAGVNAGSFGLINPYLQYQQRLSDYWSYIINGYTENANGDYKYSINNGATTTEENRIGSNVAVQQADGALYWTKTDSNKFNLHVNFYNSSQGLPGAVVLYTPPPYGQMEWQRDYFFQSGYEKIWKNSLHLLINTKLSSDYLRYLDPNYNNGAALDDSFTQHEIYQSAVLSYKPLPNWEISYASDFALNNIDANTNHFAYPTRITLLNVLATNFTFGKLLLQGNLLNTNITETVRTGSAVPNRNVYSPTIMASIKPLADQGFQIRTFYKNLFRDPTFAETYYGAVADTNLKPEFAKEYDFGITYNKALTGLLDYVAVTADEYYNTVTNKIVFQPGFDGAVNYGRVDIEGVDASIKTQANLGNGFKLPVTINYSYQSVVNVTNPKQSDYLNQLPYIPKNTLAFNTGLNKSHYGLYYNQVISSTRYFNNNNDISDELPSYTISEATAVYRGTYKKFPVAATFGVDNLFNKNYVVVQSYPMPGRSYKLSFQITI
jgi:vitamin B12 transporter